MVLQWGPSLRYHLSASRSASSSVSERLAFKANPAALPHSG